MKNLDSPVITAPLTWRFAFTRRRESLGIRPRGQLGEVNQFSGEDMQMGVYPEDDGKGMSVNHLHVPKY